MERTGDEKARAVIANLQQMMIFAEAHMDKAKAQSTGTQVAVWYAQAEALKLATNCIRSEFGFPI